MLVVRIRVEVAAVVGGVAGVLVGNECYLPADAVENNMPTLGRHDVRQLAVVIDVGNRVATLAIRFCVVAHGRHLLRKSASIVHFQSFLALESLLVDEFGEFGQLLETTFDPRQRNSAVSLGYRCDSLGSHIHRRPR